MMLERFAVESTRLLSQSGSSNMQSRLMIITQRTNCAKIKKLKVGYAELGNWNQISNQDFTALRHAKRHSSRSNPRLLDAIDGFENANFSLTVTSVWYIWPRSISNDSQPACIAKDSLITHCSLEGVQEDCV